MTLLRWSGTDSVSLDEVIDRLDEASFADAAWRATVIRIRDARERELLYSHARRARIRVHDRFDDLVGELVRCHAPSSEPAERQAAVARRRARSADGAADGCWVWLPWARTIVHLLAHDEFNEVRTNRNRDKITRAEQQVLRTKRIAIVGLSVGGEAAVTIAQEALCGHIVLADFDPLDLSNLNRLGAGVQDLGVNKAVIVARRIAQCDPYLAMTLVQDGVTPDNLPSVLDGLDLLLDECDAMSIKELLRHGARARGLDVIYAGDERGFLSIEPYSRHPEQEFLHGLVRQPARDRSSYPTAQAFLQDLTQWLGGWDRISERSRLSLAQVGDTLCGYPQLAGEARFAAGQLAHVARRMLLGEPLAPAWYQLDLDERLQLSAARDAPA